MSLFWLIRNMRTISISYYTKVNKYRESELETHAWFHRNTYYLLSYKKSYEWQPNPRKYVLSQVSLNT